MALHVFPLELRHSQKDWPFVEFSVAYGKEHVYLPIPEGLTFSDAMIYSDINLGILGNVGQRLAGAMAGAASTRGDLGDKVIGAGKAAIDTLKSSTLNAAAKANVAAAASIAARQVMRMDDIADTIDYGTRQIVAPNTRTKFDNSSVRSFQFGFKMVARTKADSDTIWNITQVFQQYMYPEGNDIIMKYPPTWEITFYDGTGNENKFIPGIYECYLTTFTPTYNASTNIFHEDGSPVEVDIVLGFQETKALTRDEIKSLNERK